MKQYFSNSLMKENSVFVLFEFFKLEKQRGFKNELKNKKVAKC